EVPAFAEWRETWLEVRHGGEVITVLELLSPTNKLSGAGRAAYEQKRAQVLASPTHLVEIDLLRGGQPMAFRGTDRRADYRILVSRGDQRPRAEVRLFSLREPMPRFPLPLRRGDREPEVDLGAILHRLYDLAGYDLRVDYSAPPVPPLDANDAA